MKNKFGIIIIVSIFGCIPPTVENQNNNLDIYGEIEDCEPCPLLLNFASSNYQNQDWRGAVNNYNKLIKFLIILIENSL